MAEKMGFGPTIFPVTGGRGRPLLYNSVKTILLIAGAEGLEPSMCFRTA